MKAILHPDVLANIIEVAKENHPREFVLLLKGKFGDGDVYVESLIYQPYEADTRATRMKIDLPFNSGAVGSCHSHPGPNVHPSGADLRLFNKLGYVHIIIAHPYTEDSMRAYNKYGGRVELVISQNT